MRTSAIFLMIVTTAILAGCQPKEPAESALAVPTVGQCEASGGKVTNVGMTGMPACLIPTEDAGKSCRDSSDCEGRCIVDDWEGDKPPRIGTKVAGVCEASNLTFGCFAEVRRGRINSVFLCVD